MTFQNNRRANFTGLGSMALLLCAILVCNSSYAAERPNVLLICVDDLKPLLGCYGDPLIKSPNIDRLAARGVIFDRAYCNQAVCSPSRNALMLSLRPQTLGIYDLPTNFRKAAPDAVTMAQHFRAGGYRTEAIGKIFHVGHGNHEDAASWTVPHAKGDGVQYADRKNGPPGGAGAGGAAAGEEKLRGAPFESADVPDETYVDGGIASEAIRRIEGAKAKPGEPFFLAVGFIKPHLPFCAPKKYWDLYDRNIFKLPEMKEPPAGAPSYAPQFGGELRQYKDVPQGKSPIPDDQARTLIHGYHAAVSYMDAQLGRVLDALDKSGLAGNTIIVLWGDHGWHLGDHGMWCKHTNYEQATRIPLIVAGPGVASGARSGGMIESVDLYPTLSAVAGLPERKGLDGVSAAALLKDPAGKGRESVTHVYPRGDRIGRSIRNERYRMVEWKRPGEPADKAEIELYDYQGDPQERKNWAAEKTEVVADLRAILAKQPEAKPQIKAAAAPVAGEKPGAKPKVDREELFKKKDKDGDGKLTRAEFLANQPDPEGAAKRWETFDANKDGFLSREEFVGGGKK